MFDQGCTSLVFLRSALVVCPCNIQKVSRLLTGKKGQLKKEIPSVAMMTNFGFGPLVKSTAVLMKNSLSMALLVDIEVQNYVFVRKSFFFFF